MFGLEAGDLATWVAAVIALGALGVAAISVLFSAAAAFVPAWLWFKERRDRQDAERRRDEAERERNDALELYQRKELERLEAREWQEDHRARRAQAALIHVWGEGALNKRSVEVFPETSCTVLVSNTSQAPITRMWIEADYYFLDLEADRTLGDASYSLNAAGYLSLDILPPTGNHPLRLDPGETIFRRRYDPDRVWLLTRVIVTRIGFTDADGAAWTRIPDQGLEKAKEAEHSHRGYEISRLRMQYIEDWEAEVGWHIGSRLRYKQNALRTDLEVYPPETL